MRLLYRLQFRSDHGWAPDRMSEYLDDELERQGRERLERHMRDCPECERLLAGLRALVDGLGGLPAPDGGAGATRIAAVVRARLDEPPSA